MVTRLLVLAGIFLLAAYCYAEDLDHTFKDIESESSLRALFDSWKTRHGVTLSAIEVENRFRIFEDNVQFVHAKNQENKSYKLAVNHFAHLSHEEFKAKYTGLVVDTNRPLRNNGKFSHENVVAADAVDWRELGAVTPVKNQGTCGSCWAFSATGAIEGVNAIATGELVSLSEQELIDCDKVNDMGCSGGLMDYAFEFIISNGGIDTEDDYPYKGVNGVCDVARKNHHVVTIDDYEDVPRYSEASLLKAVMVQPVCVAIEADEREFQFYSSGVFDDACGTSLDHGVLAVGYGTEAGVPYWIVKNSWGAAWGEAGYIRLRRGVASPFGLCGIAMQPSYPLKTGPNPPPGPPVPPTPTPSPSVCDSTHSCAAGTTCCCSIPYSGFCLAWGCCPMESATCCDDNKHCCPQEFPVCRLDVGLCMKGAGPEDTTGVAMLARSAASWRWPAVHDLLGRKSGVQSHVTQEKRTEELAGSNGVAAM